LFITFEMVCVLIPISWYKSTIKVTLGTDKTLICSESPNTLKLLFLTSEMVIFISEWS